MIPSSNRTFNIVLISYRQNDIIFINRKN